VTRPIDDPRITAIGLLFETQAVLAARFGAHFAGHGLSQVEFDVLIKLARAPGQHLRMSDLAAQTVLSTSGVTRVVDRLERDGLISRRSCESDRRISYAALTGTGQDRVNETLPGYLELIEKTFTGQFCGPKLDELLGALRTVRDAQRV
jgi:MarR family transcriptional regulator, 2-MHQ and catechol-resistance regulon repressor